MIFAQFQQPLTRQQDHLDDTIVGWAYVGSANLTESAWYLNHLSPYITDTFADFIQTARGHLSRDRSTKQPKLNCRNWECGVIIPIPATRADLTSCLAEPAQKRSVPSLSIFEGVVPVPMVAGDEYGRRRPWFFKEDS